MQRVSTYIQGKVHRSGAHLSSVNSLFGEYGVLRGGIFDHHLTTTVQSYYKTQKKPVVITNNELFLVLAANVQNQQNLRFIVGLRRPVAVLRPGRPEVRILPVAPNHENPNLFSIGEGFGFFVFFGKQNESLASIEKCPRPYHKKARQTIVRVP